VGVGRRLAEVGLQRCRQLAVDRGDDRVGGVGSSFQLVTRFFGWEALVDEDADNLVDRRDFGQRGCQ
jgi:hypothetical protein